MRKHVVVALQHSELYVDQVKDARELSKHPIPCIFCNTAIAFIDDDVLLGYKPHNRPLFMVCYIREQKVNRILIHGGLAEHDVFSLVNSKYTTLKGSKLKEKQIKTLKYARPERGTHGHI